MNTYCIEYKILGEIDKDAEMVSANTAKEAVFQLCHFYGPKIRVLFVLDSDGQNIPFDELGTR